MSMTGHAVQDARPAFRRRFSILPTIDGFEIVDSDGRAVGRRDTAQSANGVVYNLNLAANRSPKALCAALGAT